MIYINEFEPFAVQWLSNLSFSNLIPFAFVDPRSIKDVTPDCITGFKQCHFFGGIAGWPLAFRMAGLGDDLNAWSGSCPCQPFSQSGKQKGQSDDRHLWPVWFKLIRQCRPEYIFGEQVANAIGHGWLDGVFADLETEDYTCGAVVLGAHSAKSPHIRQRLWFGARLADANERRHNRRESASFSRKPQHAIETETSRSINGLADDDSQRFERRSESHRIEDERSEPASRWTDAGGCGGTGRMEHSTGDGRIERGTESSWRSVASGCGDGRLGQSFQSRLEGYAGHVGHGSESGRHAAEQDRSIAASGVWSDYRIVPCLDGKSRRIGTSYVKVVDGLFDGVGSSQPAMGGMDDRTININGDLNNGPPESEIANKVLPELREAASAKNASGRKPRTDMLLAGKEILQPQMHGTWNGGNDEDIDTQEPSSTVTKGCKGKVPKLRKKEHEASCASRRLQSNEQRSFKLSHIVRLLPSSLSLAELRGDRATAKALQDLRKSIYENGTVLQACDSPEIVWRSMSDEAKARIEICFGARQWVVCQCNPLAYSIPSKNSDPRMMEVLSDLLKMGYDERQIKGMVRRARANRVGRLKGYGNAIVPQVAAMFIRAFMESD